MEYEYKPYEQRVPNTQYKELIKPNHKKANNLILKWAKDFIKHLIKENGK